jgi:hypothetical protein
MSQTSVFYVRVYCLYLPFAVGEGYSSGIQERGGSWTSRWLCYRILGSRLYGCLPGSHITLAVAGTCYPGGGEFFYGATVSSGPGPSLYRGTSLDRTSLDERSVRRRDLYLTTHRIHKRQASMPRRIRTHSLSKRAAADLDCAATGIGQRNLYFLNYIGTSGC